MANEFKVKNGLIVSGSADFEQDLRVRGTLTVDEFHTSITTSSIIFESGSTSFGNSFDDTHTLTGSVNITGSITLNGQAIGTGKLDETTFNTYTSSYKVATTDFNSLTGSYNSFTTSYISDSSSFNSRVGVLETFSSSLDVSFVNEVEFGSFSSSIKTFTSSLNSYTNSLDNKLNTIDNFTGSANGRLNSIESATSSLYSFSSSVNNRLSTVETSTGSLNTFSSSTNTRLNSIETSTSSLNSYSSSNDVRLGFIESFTSSINTTIKNKLNSDGVISGSAQILNGSNIVSSSAQVTTYGFAITGSNLFNGTQTLSGSIIPAVDNAYDLGSPTYQWRDVYISSGSLYVDGTKVLSSTAQELQITTDNGQSIKILESGTDSIILQTADGDIELKSNADGDILLDPTNGKIMLKGPVEILNGNKIQSSVGGTPVVFANDIVVSGSIDITGTIEGINLTDFSSSVNTRVSNLETSGGSLNSFTSSTNTRLNSIETSTSSLNTFTSSTNTKLGVIESTTSSLNSYTSSNNTRLGVIETTTGSLNTFTSSTNTRLSNLETSSGSLNSFTSSTSGRLISIETSTSSLNSFTSSINTTIKNRLNAEGVISGSVQINITDTTGYSTFSSSISSSAGALSSSIATTTNNLSTSVATYNLGQDNRLGSIEGKTGSYATTGSNIFIGNQVITGSIFVSQDLIIAGSSSIQHISSSVVNIADNIITVNAQNPSIRFGGLAVIDSGSSPQVSGSMLFDSTNDQWIFVHQNQATVTSSVLLMGPQTFNNLGNESYPTTNRVLKSVNAEHVGDSNITDTGTKVSINSNTEITGGLVVTGTVSGTNITTIQSSVNSLNSYTSSNTTNINAIQTSTASLNSYTSSTNTRLGVIETTTGSLNTFTSSASSRLSSLETASGSIRTDFNSYTSSNNGRVNSIETSTSSLNTFTSSINTTIKTRLNAEGVLSGSSQVSFGSISGVPSGLVSGSSQVSYTGLSNVPSGIVSGSSQVSYPSLSNIPSGIVSGSSQITYGNISGIPGGIVSGSVQVDLTATTNYSTGIKTRLSAEGVLSGSAQVVSALPSGTVSGSAQVNIASTTGFSTYLDQAVKSGSTVSFAGLTVNGSSVLSNNTAINPSGYTNNVVAGAVGDSGWRVTTGIGGNAGANNNWTLGHNGTNLYFGISNGTTQSLTTWMEVKPTRTVLLNSYTTNGFVKFTNSDGTLAVDTTTYYSSSSQVSLTGTTGFGTYLNQAVLTSSSPSFAGITSTAGITVSGTAYYTFNKPSTASYQTVALFGTTSGGIFITSDNAIISKGAYYNNGWIATSAAGSLIDFAANSSQPGIATFSGATIGGAVTFSSTQIILHAGNYNSYSPTLTGTGASGTWGISISGNAATATTAGALTSMNISQFTNNSGYLTSVTNISGNAGTVTNGVYTTGDQTISGTKTFAVIKGDSGSDYPHSFTNTDAGNTHWTNRGSRLLTSNGTNWVGDGRDPIMALVGSTSATTRGRMIGLTLHNDDNTDNAFSPMLTFSSKSTSSGYNTVYASISGRKTGYVTGVDTNWAKGELHFYVHGDSYVADTPTLRMTNTQSIFTTSLSSTTSLAVNTSNDSSSATGGITLWDAGGTTTSWFGFKNTSNTGWGGHGPITGYATYFVMDTANRGWIFRRATNGGTDFTGTNVASISNGGRFIANEGYQFLFNGTNRGGLYAKTTWFGTGSDYSPSICAEGGLGVNLYVDGSTTKGVSMDTSGHFYPVGNGSQNLGTSSLRWATVYTSDLSLSNGIGDYTIVEGEEKLYLYNNKNNKVYSFVLQEEDPKTATPKKS